MYLYRGVVKRIDAAFEPAEDDSDSSVAEWLSGRSLLTCSSQGARKFSRGSRRVTIRRARPSTGEHRRFLPFRFGEVGDALLPVASPVPVLELE